MLIIITILMTLICIYVVSVKKDRMSLLLLALGLSFLIMFVGVIIYIAKSGGYSTLQRFFLFLLPSIQMKLQYLPISLDTIGYMVAIGRFIFPVILLVIAANYSMISFIRSHMHYFKFLAIPTLVGLICYYPSVFRSLVKGRYLLQNIIIKWSFIWIISCLLIAILLMIIEYRSITMNFCKKQFRLIMLSYSSIAILYSLYCIQDPAQIYEVFGVEYQWIKGVSYTASATSALGWVGITLCGIFFVVLGSVSLVNYTQISVWDEKSEIALQRKFDATNMGTTVFVHSIKNQLLANRVLNKKISQALQIEHPDLEKIKYYAKEMNELNERMLTRMEELYKTVKANAMYLVPLSIEDPIQLALRKFHDKYPDYEVELQVATTEDILTDEIHLSEAIYNLLTNAYEAAKEARGDYAKVEIKTYNERLYTVIEVKDNGAGISKANEQKIFDPFFTSKNTNYNWGMGLYYVKTIVQGHFGSVRIESQEGEGTSLFILLPKYSSRF